MTSWGGGDREGGLETAPRTASRSQEEQHQSHENCLDAASDDLLDLQRNLPERRGRSRELEDYRLRKEYLEYEVRSRCLTLRLDPLPPSHGRGRPCSLGSPPLRAGGGAWVRAPALCAWSAHANLCTRLHKCVCPCALRPLHLLFWEHSSCLSGNTRVYVCVCCPPARLPCP